MLKAFLGLANTGSNIPDAGEPPLRLNRCLPIFQGFFPSGQDQKDQKAKKCHWCGSTESPAWNRVQDDETLTKYACLKCHLTGISPYI